MGRGCDTVKASKEGWVNARVAVAPWMSPLIDQTQAESSERYDLFSDNMELRDNKYTIFGEEIELRASEVTKRKLGLPEFATSPDNEIQKKGGDQIHLVMKDIVNSLAMEDNRMSDIRAKYTAKQDFSLTLAQFNNLHELGKKIVKDINKIQERIDPKGKAIFKLEAPTADNLRNIGGTQDLVVIFSNNTGLIYDYKTTGRNNPIGVGMHGKEVVRVPLPIGDVRAFDLSMTEYKRQNLEIIGIKDIIQARLFPIAVSYKLKDHDDIKEDSKFLPQFQDVIGYQPASDFLRPIPVAGDRSKWEGINSLIEKQYELIEDLEKAYKTEKKEDERIRIRERINRLERSIMKSLVDEDIAGLLSTMYALTQDVELRLEEVTTLPDGSKNPLALDIVEAQLLRAEMEVYHDIIKYTNAYFKDLQETDEAKYEQLIARLNTIEPHYNRVRDDLIIKCEQFALDEVATRHKDADGNLLPYSELSTPDLTFARISAIDNPIYQAAWKLLQDAQYDTKQKFLALDEDVHKKTDALFKWGKENGYSNKMDVFGLIINKATGNLFSKMDPKFYDKVESALESKDKDAVKFMKENFIIKDEANWDSNYAARLEYFKKYTKDSLNGLKPSIDPTTGAIVATGRKLQADYKAAVENWEKNNDLRNSDDAWVYKGNRIKYLKVSQKALKDNESTEYKSIKVNQPLLDYYEMWHDRMEEFSEILGITRYSDLPYNFIPNIRKEMLEHLTMDNLNVFGAVREFIDSFNVREEDVYIKHVDKDGLVRKIPILFMNRLQSKSGEKNANLKSYDLSTSLKIFGHMAYNYEHMSKIEPKILGLRTLLGEPSPGQGGMQVRDRLGRKIMGKIQPFLTKEGRNTETYRLFEDITDYYLYGIKFKDSSLLPGIDTVHLLTKAKNFNSAIKLGFAVIPALGAFTAGTFGSIFTGKKGIAYTDKHYYNATKYIVTDAPKYIALSKFIDPENDSYMERALMEDMASWKKRWMRDRTLFGFLRDADKRMMRNIMVAMSQNFGVKDDGSIIRLNRKTVTEEERQKYKPIWDLVEIDADGKATVKGLSKDGYIAFREAVKNTSAEIIGNMNPDDVGRMDTSLYINQFMAFRSWMPEVIRERFGKLRWDNTSQSMKWGRFGVLKNEFSMELTEQQKIDYKLMSTYMTKILVPKMTALVADIALFGIVPSRMLKAQNMQRAKIKYQMWLSQNPAAKADGATFEDFLEIKEAQIKAVITEIRVIASIMALAIFLGSKGDDGEARYYSNWITRTMYKVFTKAGSELTFMWNPTEAERLIKNPFPVAGIITLMKNTITNTFDETRDTVFGENSKQDKAPMWYYSSQWVPGLSQLTRFFEVFEQQKKTAYQVYQLN